MFCLHGPFAKIRLNVALYTRNINSPETVISPREYRTVHKAAYAGALYFITYNKNFFQLHNAQPEFSLTTLRRALSYA